MDEVTGPSNAVLYYRTRGDPALILADSLPWGPMFAPIEKMARAEVMGVLVGLGGFEGPIIGAVEGTGLAGSGEAAADTTDMAAARQAGMEGEDLAGIDQAAKVRIPSATGTATYRVPDALTDTTLTEVKNVASLSYTSQLQDFYQYASATGRSFDLIVRTNTQLSGPLEAMEASGQINVVRSLPAR